MAKYGYVPDDIRKHSGQWTATGKQFAVPFVFKTLFSREPITMGDMCETFSVSSALYLDMNETLPDVESTEKGLAKLMKESGLTHEQVLDFADSGELPEDCDSASLAMNLRTMLDEIAGGHNYHFVGKVGQFTPVKPGTGGGVLLRESGGKYSAAAGSKGYRWMESEMLRALGREDCIDRSYYNKLVDDAIAAIGKYGDFEWFQSEDRYDVPPEG